MGEQLEPAAEAIETLMTAPRPVPEVEPVPEAYLQARDHFAERQGLIGAHVLREMLPTGASPSYLALANRELRENIAAALALGDMQVLGLDLEWLEGLMLNYQAPVEVLRDYLVSYKQTAERTLGEPGAPVVAWLDEMLRSEGG